MDDMVLQCMFYFLEHAGQKLGASWGAESVEARSLDSSTFAELRKSCQQTLAIAAEWLQRPVVEQVRSGVRVFVLGQRKHARKWNGRSVCLLQRILGNWTCAFGILYLVLVLAIGCVCGFVEVFRHCVGASSNRTSQP